MINVSEWIVMKDEYIWDFYIDYEEKLVANLIYKDNIIEEKIIDIEVEEFSLSEGLNKNILGAYIKESKLYCFIFDYKKIFKKVLYTSKKYIAELTVVILGDEINILFIEKVRLRSISGNIINCAYKSDKIQVSSVAEINFISQNNTHYHIEKLDDNSIMMLYLNKKLDQIKVNVNVYKKNNWNNDINLYEIKGSRVEISCMYLDDRIIILNLSKCMGKNILELVEIEDGKKSSYTKIFESSGKIYNSFLMREKDEVWIIWQEGVELFGAKYGDDFKYIYVKDLSLELQENEEIQLYNCININTTQCMKILGGERAEFNFIFPNIIFKESNRISLDYSSEEKQDKFNYQQIKEKIDNLKNEKIKIEQVLKNLDADFRKASDGSEVFLGNSDNDDDNYKDLKKELENIKKINNDILKGCM